MKNLGNFKVTSIDILNKDIDLWGADENNKKDQLTILVSDESLYEVFSNPDSVWNVLEYNGEYGMHVLVELLHGIPTGEFITL